MKKLAVYLVPALAAAALATILAPAPATAAESASEMPSGMVAFFQRADCPHGWGNVSAAWSGRYVVIAQSSFGQLIGTPLDPGENRPTGDHRHGTGPAFQGGDCTTPNACAAWGGLHGISRGALPIVSTSGTQPGETVKPGTNAPYVTLRACVKS